MGSAKKGGGGEEEDRGGWKGSDEKVGKESFLRFRKSGKSKRMGRGSE